MGNRILIVEDEADFAGLLKERLARAGYIVDIANDGVEGLEKIKGSPPDLIILDIIMPRMDGYTFFAEMKNKNYKIPVIVLTAKSGMKELFSFDGVREYMVKPFEPEDLLVKIRKVLG